MKINISEMMTYTYFYLSGNIQGSNSKQIQQFLFWSILFGPVLFPFSLIVWHAYQLSKGESNFLLFKNVARLLSGTLLLVFIILHLLPGLEYWTAWVYLPNQPSRSFSRPPSWWSPGTRITAPTSTFTDVSMSSLPSSSLQVLPLITTTLLSVEKMFKVCSYDISME